VDQLLQSVDASHLADARVGALSGGEQQRILIAHALASQPQLLLLDEPLASLDPRSTQETASLLGRIARERKVGVLLSTHDINPLLPLMDRVVYLAAGRAVSGRTEEVVRSDVLSALYRHHVDVFHAHGRVLVSVGEEQSEQGCELDADDCAATVTGTGQP
jgi:zinc/manganese transport system ATP-binding protein